MIVNGRMVKKTHESVGQEMILYNEGGWKIELKCLYSKGSSIKKFDNHKDALKAYDLVARAAISIDSIAKGEVEAAGGKTFTVEEWDAHVKVANEVLKKGAMI